MACWPRLAARLGLRRPELGQPAVVPFDRRAVGSRALEALLLKLPSYTKAARASSSDSFGRSRRLNMALTRLEHAV
jgi:hypothetical protein